MNALSKAAKAMKDKLVGAPAPAPETGKAADPITQEGEPVESSTAPEPETRAAGEGAVQDEEEGAQGDAGSADRPEGDEDLVRCEVLAFDGLVLTGGRHARAGEIVHLPVDLVRQYAAVGQLKILE